MNEKFTKIIKKWKNLDNGFDKYSSDLLDF